MDISGKFSLVNLTHSPCLTP